MNYDFFESYQGETLLRIDPTLTTIESLLKDIQQRFTFSTWTVHMEARDKEGHYTASGRKEAVCWCAFGHIRKSFIEVGVPLMILEPLYQDYLMWRAEELLGESIISFNDNAKMSLSYRFKKLSTLWQTMLTEITLYKRWKELEG